jgi:hypothetical protein
VLIDVRAIGCGCLDVSNFVWLAMSTLRASIVHWGQGADVPLYFYDDEYGLTRDSTT